MNINQIIGSLDLPADKREELEVAFEAAVNTVAESRVQVVTEKKIKSLKRGMYRTVRERAKVAFKNVASHLYTEAKTGIDADCKQFKEDLVESTQIFIESHLNSALPAGLVKEEADARFNKNIVEGITKTLLVKEAHTNPEFKKAVKTAKIAVESAQKENDGLVKELTEARQTIDKHNAAIAFAKATKGCTQTQKSVLSEQFRGKSAADIKKHLPGAVDKLISGKAQPSSRSIVSEGSNSSVVTEDANNDLVQKGQAIVAEAKKRVAKAKAKRKASDNGQLTNVMESVADQCAMIYDEDNL